MIKQISVPLKQLMKDTYFLPISEVETICSAALYLYPLQEFIDKVSQTYTAFEVNAALSFIQRNFAKSSHAHWEDRDGELVLFIGSSISLHVLRGNVKAYDSVPNSATSTGMARLEKRG